MLSEVAPGVWTHQSATIATNAVVVRGDSGALVVDPGLTRDELACLARDIREQGMDVTAGFATHPDWDHVLWHPDLGTAPRYGTERAAAAMQQLLSQPAWEERVAGVLPPEIVGEVPMELFGQLTALPGDATHIPVDGLAARVIRHDAHAPGHAALLVEQARVLIAGDMLSDVLVPMPDLRRSEGDPLAEYLTALDRFAAVADEVDLVIPGHGGAGSAADLRTRLDQDRAYIEALADGREVSDPRVDSPQPGWEWVSFIHENNVEQVAARA